MLTPEDIAEIKEGAIERSDKRQQGIYPQGKYWILRKDGRDIAPNDKHYGCQYFVLDVTHDPYAVPALRTYADACEREYPKLASDLREWMEFEEKERVVSNG